MLVIGLSLDDADRGQDTPVLVGLPKRRLQAGLGIAECGRQISASSATQISVATALGFAITPQRSGLSNLYKALRNERLHAGLYVG
jgi:hypothetical protein